MWLLVIASLLPARDVVIRDRVDVTEVNRIYDDGGRESLVQVVWWNWSVLDEEYRVVAWRLITDTGHPLPHGDRWWTLWFDQKSHVVRCVESKMFRIRHTVYDVDLEDRKVLPEEKRKGLTNSRLGS